MKVLRPDQEEAVQRMLGQPAFIDADEMGLGKTVVQTEELGRYFALDDSPPAVASNILIACPDAAKDVWVDHLAERIPELPVVVGSGKASDRERVIPTYQTGALILNWGALRALPRLIETRWDYIIADEVHEIKNRKALRTKALKKLRADHKRALSGTPIINRPDEAWSTLNWLFPKLYRSYWRFFYEYCVWYSHPQTGMKIYVGAQNEDKLAKELEPFMIRHLKKDVLPELVKYYTPMKLDMEPKQAKAYREMKRNSEAWLEQEPQDVPLRAPIALSQLTRLRQFACAYAQIGDDGEVAMAEPSNKLKALGEIVRSTDKQLVVFSQFKQMIHLAEGVLDKMGVSHCSLTGDTPSEDRGPMIKDFGSGKYRVFLCTVQTGGVGIDGLQVASIAVFLDRTWSPAINLQAEDRLHRHGQKEAVQVIILQSKGTVDVKVERVLQFKWDIIKRIIGA